jgi:hypothetical protein
MRLVKDPAVGLSVFNYFYQPQNQIRRTTMKTLKAICTATILALALSVPAYAGDVETPGKTSPGTGGTSTQELTPEATDEALAAEDYDSSSALVDIIWTLASII